MKALKTTAIFSTLVTLAMLFACQPEINSNESGEEGIGGGEDNSVHVTGITLDRSSANILEGGSLTLVATVKPDNAENKNVSWSSSESAVASVDNDGKVTGIKAGSATVTAKTEDGGKTASCVITVEPNEAPSITLGAENISAISVVLKGKANLKSSASSDLKIGFQYSKSAGILPTNSITVDAEDADANYNYTTSLTGLEPGTTYYFRSLVRQNGQDEYGETKEFKTKDVESLIETLDASDVGATKATLNAKLDLTDVKYGNITYGFYWGTSESSQNTYLSGGDIANSAYATTMTDLSHKTQYWYKAYVKLDNQTFSGDVKTFTTDLIKVESVSLDKPEYSFNTIGNTLTLKATVLPADATNKSVEWVSSNADVATVDQTGKVSAVGNGTATITVTTKDQNKTATCAITVAQHITSIGLDKTELSLNEGEEIVLSASIKPDNAAEKTLLWSSSNESVATVDQTGKIRAISKGSATIKAEAQDGSGQFKTCSVTVIRLVSSITLSKSSIVIYTGKMETLTATVNPADASNTGIMWTSSNTSIATVTSAGVVKGIAPGNVSITATAKDASGVEASCEVEVRQYVTSITLDKTSLSLEVGDEITLSVTSILPDNANDKSYTWSSVNENASVDNNGKVTAKSKGIGEIKATANDGSGVFASCSIVINKIDVPQAVDMGTVVNGKKIKWASFNIGASSPEEYGSFYAWGETEPKDSYDWSTYKFSTNSSASFSKYNTDSSYGTVDNKTVLDPEDDVAHVKLGGKWRMPTEAEWQALRDKCTWTWINQNGVNGRLVTAPNGNSIFLPAAGKYNGKYHQFVGEGYYWSSSLCTGNGGPGAAWYMGFDSSEAGRCTIIYRYNGCTIRPVSN